VYIAVSHIEKSIRVMHIDVKYVDSRCQRIRSVNTQTKPSRGVCDKYADTISV